MMSRARLLFALSFVMVVFGCDRGHVKISEPPEDTDVASPRGDADGDGWLASEDCRDDNPAINPDATDLTGDDVDQNCDGVDGIDADGDGYASRVSGGEDCDDTWGSVHPGADEIYHDGRNNDCDDLTNDMDEDGDGYLDAQGGGDDCDDVRAEVHPGAAEVYHDGLNNDCDDLTNDADEDADGYFDVQGGGDDCDDGDARVHPGQQAWFANPRMNGSFDFNCDGREVRRWTLTAQTVDPAHCLGVYWMETQVPDCGETARGDFCPSGGVDYYIQTCR